MWVKKCRTLFYSSMKNICKYWMQGLDEGVDLLDNIQNMTTILETDVLDQRKVFSKTGPLNHYFLGYSEM